MAQFQLLRCSVALGGDADTTVVRGRFNPILFPELMMLQFLHGEDAVSDVHVIGTCEMPQDEALTRLQTLYKAEEVAKVFPGARPRLPLMDRSIPACTLPVHKPGPTRPDNPDPKLRPLDQYTMAAAVPDDGDDMPGFDNPEPFDPEAEEEDPGVDEALMGGATVRDALAATPPHKRDVAGRQKKHGENEHDRRKG